jgi:hypothetical protein
MSVIVTGGKQQKETGEREKSCFIFLSVAVGDDVVAAAVVAVAVGDDVTAAAAVAVGDYVAAAAAVAVGDDVTQR